LIFRPVFWGIGRRVARGCGSVEETALRLLRGAAEAFYRLWLEAESAAANLGTEPPNAATSGGHLFAQCVVLEAARRLPALAASREELRQRTLDSPNELARNPREMLIRPETLRDFPLSRELLACWYPTWRRSSPIFDSPFNAARELAPFATAARPRVEDPERQA
jgi:hypothetical protein